MLFYLMADRLSYLLDTDPEKTVSPKGVARRRKLHFIIKCLGPLFLTRPQIMENRNALTSAPGGVVPADPGITLPKEPVIWAANHCFKDDTLATVLAAQRHGYILFGSLPQFYNTMDGLTAWLNGVVMVNRKVSASRKSSITKAVRAMEMGADLIVFPEGVWNKSPNELILNLWPGIYHIACETGAKVVPVVHYVRDPAGLERNDPIHTVLDNPIRLDDLSKSAALDYLRDVMASWHYLMMERYGEDSRERLLKGKTSTEAWEYQLTQRVATAARYDREIELCADYRPSDTFRPESVWEAVASISNVTPENVHLVSYAQDIVTQQKNEDFQRRF